MNQDRRKFLKTAGATLALTAITGNIAGCRSSSLFGADRIKEFGLQLYTLRDVLPKDPKGILKQVAAMGYKQIESYEHDKLGMFWGMKNTEFKKCMDDLGMKLVASHFEYTKELERKADEAAEIGMKYLLCPWIGSKKTLDAYKATAESFNKAGELCKQRGIQFGYHNHDYSFKKVEGQFPQDILMQNTEGSLVEYEMDMYWVTVAGQDPVEWIKKYPGRFTLAHVKDGKAGKTSILGMGSINYPSILKEAHKAGMKYFIVEQEDYEGTTPVNAANADAAYMKNLKL
jgi:sugar phosphate isomerase/epimerase